jgi:peptidoglycan/LPS O-acetylase OafA/YrhL
LLLAEKKVSGGISVKEFYIRRVLRIWPLYFFLVLMALFLFPQISFLDIPGDEPGQSHWLKYFLYMIILPNIAVKMFPAVPFIGQTWSIGVEEQFYLIWPWLVKKSQNILNILIGVIVVYLLILLGLEYVAKSNPTANGWKIAADVWHVSSIDCMAIGGIFAWLHFYRREQILRYIRNDFMEVFSVLAAIGLIFMGIRFPLLHHEIYAVLFGIIILNLATKDQSIIRLEHPIPDYLGKISYGIYMYHVICIVIAYKLLKGFMGDVNSWMLYALSIGLTILISGLSYEWLEFPFIRMKSKFTKIISGDSARK